MPLVTGVRFKKACKVYYFDKAGFSLKEGDGVIVETAKGMEFGTVSVAEKEVKEGDFPSPLKPVIRLAEEKDYLQMEENEKRRPEALKQAQEKIAKHKLDMKLVDAEFTYDATKVIFYFTAEGRVDFRELVKDLAAAFRMRIELRQIGIRDECKMLGGVAPCGRACCCSQHQSDFEHVSIKMAKNQGLSLNPSKISGLCGRLMCCLSYENAHYVETGRQMPKIGSDVRTPDGNGTVVSNNMLKKLVSVRMPLREGYEIKEYKLEHILSKVTMAEEIDKEDAADRSDVLPES